MGEGSGYKVFTESLLWLQEQQGMEPALEDFTTVSFIHGTHAFIQQILTEQLLCGRHCVELQDAEANKTNKFLLPWKGDSAWEPETAHEKKDKLV